MADPVPTDTELVLRTQAGGRLAAGELVERYQDLARKLVHKMKLPPWVEKEDLFAVGLESLWKAARFFDPNRISPKTGKPVKFITAAYWIVWNDLRREAGRLSCPGLTCSSQLDFGDDESDARISPEMVPARVEVEPPAGLLEAVAKLPPVLRTVVELAAGLDGEPPPWTDIAAAVGLSIPQAKRAYALALTKL